MLNLSETWFNNLEKEAPTVITLIKKKYETNKIGYLELIYHLQEVYQFEILPINLGYKYRLLKNNREIKMKYASYDKEKFFDSCIAILIFNACIDLEISYNAKLNSAEKSGVEFKRPL